MSSVRNAAGEGATVFGTNANAVTSPTQAYAGSGPPSANRYPAFSPPSQAQSQQQSPQNAAFDSIDRRTDIGNMYVPMQPDQFSSYSGPPPSGGPQAGGTASGTRLPGIQPGQTMPPSFYGGAVVAAGGGTGGAGRGMFDPSAAQGLGSTKEVRRGSNQESWPR